MDQGGIFMRRLNILQAGVATALLTLSGAAATAQELVRLGLAVPHNAAYVQFYAAETLGFYKEAGVKPELTLYRGGAASQEALSAGAADIITYFGAGVALAVSKGAKEMEPTLPDMIVASQEMMDKRPQIVRGTLAAIYKAVVHLRNNREWALKYLKDFTEEKDDKVNVLTYEQVVVPLSQDGIVKPEWISNSINIAAKVWGLEDLRKVNPQDIYTNAFLPSAPR